MHSQADEVKQIAAQLLAGMLANPNIYPTASHQLSREQQEELIKKAIAMAETLIAKAETQIESHWQQSLSLP